MGSIGDVMRGLAVASRLRKELPAARITWLVEPKCAPLVRLHSGINETLVFHRSSPLKGLIQLRADLRSRNFDVCLDMQRHFKSGVFSMLSGAPRRIGFNRKDAKEGNFLFNNEHIPFCGDGVNKFDHYFKFLEHLGIGVGEEKTAFLADWGSEIRGPDLNYRKSLGLVLGSSWESKDWPEGHCKHLIDRVLEVNDTGIVLLGDAASAGRADRILQTLRGERGGQCDRVLNMAGKMSLEELAGAVRALDVCAGPDSGPGHIAAAVGTPYVALFGPTSAARTAPRGREVEVLSVSVPCGPCCRRRCPGLGTVCMTRIEPEEVFARVRRYLEE